jgi:protein involved in polysaccharide export with SLBB domain
MRLRTLFALAAMALGLVGCASSGASLPPLESAEVGSGTSAGYRLGPGDKLRIIVFGAEDLSGEFIVSDGGFVNAPLVGDVKATGLGTQDFANALQRRLADGYMRDPKVSVQVATYRPFYIFGEVTKPGEYPYANGMSVMNAVALGGGFSYRAQQNYVIVTRQGKDYKAGPTSKILPDDIVRVPERFF